jgi:molecular chaperone GrpE
MGAKKPTEQESDFSDIANGEDIVDISSESAALENEDETSKSDDVEETEKDPIEVLQDDLVKKQDEIAELKHEFLLYKAETENFKKRLRKEKEDFSQYANEKLLKELILINDNLERALFAENPTVESMKEGVDMILKQFQSFLEKEKVELIEALGKKFDPAIHEVLCQVETDEHEENTVTEEFSKGYQLNGRILRPSKVVIAKPPTKKEPETSDEEEPEISE